MDIEISLKIRSAIKAKLVELGCHVDEELPDYIMVLIANRRTQEQMEEDLSLFLSDNTNNFTSWLHHVLKKLDQIKTSPGGGKPSLFGNTSARVSTSSEVEVPIPTPNSTPNVKSKPDKNKTENNDKLKRTRSDGKIEKMKHKGTKTNSSSLSGKTSPSKKIKINKENFKSGHEDETSLHEDSSVCESSSSAELGEPTCIQIPEEPMGEGVDIDNQESTKTRSPTADEFVSTAIAVEEEEPIFKIPSITSAKKIRNSKRKSVKDQEEDDEDYLNLKAEADDLFLEPGTQSKKSMRKDVKGPDASDASELELLRQNVLQSTRRKRPIMERLGLPVNIIKLSDYIAVSNVPEADVSEKIEPTTSVSLVAEGKGDLKKDRKKISSRNIQSLNRIIQSNCESLVRQNSKSEPESSKSDSTKLRSQDESSDRRSSSSKHSRGWNSNDKDEIVGDKERHRSSHKRKLDHEDEHRIERSKQLKSSIGSVINRIERGSLDRDRVERASLDRDGAERVSRNRVDVVSRNRSRFETEEEYDPSCPEVNTKLQSIIKVPENSKKFKLNSETHTKLLFRAIADAEQSLLQTRQNKSEFQEKESEMELKNMKKTKTYYTKARKSVHERLGYGNKIQDNNDDDVEIVEEWEYPEEHAEVEYDLETSNFNDFEGAETIIINVLNESNDKRNVTLESKDNLDSVLVQRQQQSESYVGKPPKRISIQIHTDDDDDDDDSTTTDDENNNSDRNTSINEVIYKSEDSNSNVYNGGDSSNDFELTLHEPMLKLPSPDDQSEMENVSEVKQCEGGLRDNNLSINVNSSSKRIVARNDSRLQISVNNDMSGPASPILPPLTPIPAKVFQQSFPVQIQQPQPQVLQQQQQQCKFWPNCTFSDKCMYTHPPCKFNTGCTKPNCPYKHIGFNRNTTPTFKSQSMGSLPAKLLASRGNNISSKTPAKTCKYFPKCHSLSCPFFHPTPCRFGTGCTDMKCQNYHPGVTLAKKKFGASAKSKMDMFKWTASTSGSGSPQTSTLGPISNE